MAHVKYVAKWWGVKTTRSNEYRTASSLRRRIPVARPDLDSDKSLLGRGELGDGLGLDGSRQSASARVARAGRKRLTPSEMACLDNSPGRIRRTEVWISREEMVLFLLYDASLDASPAAKSTGQLPVASPASGRGRTNALKDVVDERVENEHRLVRDTRVGVDLLEDLVDVGRAGGRVEVSS